MSLRLLEMLSAAFPICIYETGMLLHQVCPEYCKSFHSPSYPSEKATRGKAGHFQGGCPFIPCWLEDLSVSKHACAFAACSDYYRVCIHLGSVGLESQLC